MLGAVAERTGISKLGALLLKGGCGRSSGTPKEMISTILETSLAIFSGRMAGRSFPTNFKLHRYMAKANSGKRSWPDFVVSDKTLLLFEDNSVFAIRLDLPDMHQIAASQLRTYQKVSYFVPCIC